MGLSEEPAETAEAVCGQGSMKKVRKHRPWTVFYRLYQGGHRHSAVRQNVVQGNSPADLYGASGNGYVPMTVSDNCLTPIQTGRTIHETVGDHLRTSPDEYT